MSDETKVGKSIGYWRWDPEDEWFIGGFYDSDSQALKDLSIES